MDGSGARSWPMYAAAGVLAITLALSNMPTPFYVRWAADFGFRPSVLTLLFSSYIVALLLSLALSGGLVTRFGSRLVIVLGLLLAITASAVFAGARSEWALLLARAASGLSIGAMIAGGIPWVVALGGERRGPLAVPLASGAISAGAGVGPLLSGAATLVADDPVYAAFGCELVVLVVATAVVIMLPSRDRGPRMESGGTRLLPHVERANLRHVVLGVTSFGCALGATAFLLSLGPSVLRDMAGVDAPLAAGAMASSMFLAGALVQLPGSRLPTTAMFVWAGAAIVAAAVAIALSVLLRHTAPLIVGALLAGAGYGLAQLAGLTAIAHGIERERRPAANALLNIGGYVPCGLLPVATGFAVDRLGLAQGTLLFALLIGAATTATTIIIVQARAAIQGV